MPIPITVWQLLMNERKTPQLSVMLYLSGSIEEIRSKAQLCVNAGIETLYFPDHLIGGGNADKTSNSPWLAMWPTLMDIAFRHPNIKVGTMVASSILRPVAQLAVEANTVDLILGTDRFKLTVGAGGAKSDAEILGFDQSINLSEHFNSYIKELILLLGTNSPLRNTDTLTLRLAADSLESIKTISDYGSSWVTTGGWRLTIEERVHRANLLNSELKKSRFDGECAFFTSKGDGLTFLSTQDEIDDFTSHFEFKIDEIIVPF